MHQGDYHIVEDNNQVTKLQRTIKITYDKSKKEWYEIEK